MGVEGASESDESDQSGKDSPEDLSLRFGLELWEDRRCCRDILAWLLYDEGLGYERVGLAEDEDETRRCDAVRCEDIARVMSGVLIR